MPKQLKQPWDQQKAEPAAAYARFLLYRNLGPARSLDAAYALVNKAAKGSERHAKRRAPGAWFAESVRWHWSDRATAWDVAMLAQMGQDAIVAFAAFLGDLARRALLALADPSVQPTSWEDILQTAQILNGLIDPRAVEALLHPQAVEEILPHPAKRQWPVL